VPEHAQEGLQLRTRWGRSEFVPFDEIEAVQNGGVQLRSGARLKLPSELRPAVERALAPPAPTGARADDGAAFAAYVLGEWSPLRAARSLLAIATSAGASDVHLEPHDDGMRVRLRLAGELDELLALPPGPGRRLVAALKHLAGCLPYRSDVVQEGRIAREGVAADVRASFLPTALGERVALRLFGRLLALDELGFEPATLEALHGLLGRRSGLVLVAGPSGGGKTTTVYAALAAVAARRSGAHLSIEDPVEQRLRLAGVPVDQVELDPERGLTAESALVGALRQDVDVVALGEVRTAAEADLALQAAHTGRLVLAGVHAGSAAEARQRMLDLGADPSVLEATLRGVLHQRLETQPCPEGAATDCARCGGSGRVRRPTTELWLAGEDS
jgi:type II secretory ATPase GspE/PulE/Tfp pilus assembly ATPase PilB-like protein